MLNITPPPAPNLGWVTDATWAMGALAFGLALLLWGRHLHRLVMTAATIALAVLLAVPINRSMPGVDAILIVGTLVVTFGLAGLIVARVGWAFLAGALVGIVVLASLVGHFQPASPPPAHFAPADPSFGAWARAASDTAGQALARTLWTNKDAYGTFWPPSQVPWSPSAWKILTYSGVPALLIFVLALFRSRLATFLMCSLVGASCLLAAAFLLADWMAPAFWGGAWSHPVGPLAGVLAFTGLGVFLQYRAVLAEDRRYAKPPGPQDDKPARS